MTYQGRNTVVSLASFSLILAYFLVRILAMVQAGELVADHVFRLWLTVILVGIVVTVAGTILTNLAFAVVEAIKSRQEPAFIEDERDQLIKLRGDRFGYIITSVGTFGAMLSFALGQPALVLFSALIAAGLVGQISGDLYRLVLYRRGF